MRVATLFKRLLRLGGERVLGVELIDEDEAEKVIVTLALRRRRALRCSGCTECQRPLRIPHGRSPELPTGGHQFSPLAVTGSPRHDPEEAEP